MQFKDLMFPRLPFLTEAYVARHFTDKKAIRSVLQFEISALEASHKFLIESEFLEAQRKKPIAVHAEEVDINALDLALPFPICYFELNHKDYGLTQTKCDAGIVRTIYAVLVQEVSPNNFFLRAYSQDDSKPFTDFNSWTILKQHVNLNTVDETQNVLAHLIHVLCAHVHGCNLGLERVFKTVNMKTHSLGNRPFKIENIVRLSPKVNKAYPAPIQAREIDWSNQWWVRGHWRRLTGGIGKDRNGEYKVQDFTWVTEHLKGPEDLPIRKHTYAVGAAHANA